MREPETLDEYAFLDIARKDRKRLAALRHVIDGIFDVDLHERAAVYASACGRDEPNEDDHCAAARDAMDQFLETPDA